MGATGLSYWQSPVPAIPPAQFFLRARQNHGAMPPHGPMNTWRYTNNYTNLPFLYLSVRHLATYTLIQLLSLKGQMMKTWYRYLTLGVTIAGISAAGLGTAFSAPPSEQGDRGCGNGHGTSMGRSQDTAALQESMKQRMAQHDAALRDKLKLNREQQSAWQQYTAMKQANLPAPPAIPADGTRLTAPERMEKMLQSMREHENRLASQLDALKTFYATLTPEQQKIFDAEEPAMGPGRSQRPR